MNGITFLVLISMFGQVGQNAAAVPENTARDYGWQISPEDGALEYIIQISPQKVAQMQTGQWENSSDMPPQLVGRATRVLVRIGDSILPRTPTLAEIEARIPRYNSAADLSAALGPGRVSDVESNSVVNVQGGNLPALPVNPGGLPSSNVIDQAAQAGSGLPSFGSQFLDSARNASGGTASSFPSPPSGQNYAEPNAPPPNNSLLGGANAAAPLAGSKFKDTAPMARVGSDLPSTGTPATNSASGLPNSDRGGTGGWSSPQLDPRLADNRNLPGYNAAPTGNAGDGWGNRDPQALSYNNSNFASQNQSGFGVPPGGQMPGRTLADALQQNPNMNSGVGYGGGGYGNNAYGQAYNGNAGGGGMVNTTLPNGGRPGAGNSSGGDLQNNPNIDRLAANPNANRGGGSSNESSASSSGGPPPPANARTSENFLQVFFLLSLVVNFYLAMLIRKLLTRYRSLLSSVRSQTT